MCHDLAGAAGNEVDDEERHVADTGGDHLPVSSVSVPRGCHGVYPAPGQVWLESQTRPPGRLWVRIPLPGAGGHEGLGSVSPGEEQGVGRSEAATHLPPSYLPSPHGSTRASHPWSASQSPTELNSCLRTQAPITGDPLPALNGVTQVPCMAQCHLRAC